MSGAPKKSIKHTASIEDFIPARQLNDAETLEDDRGGIPDGVIPESAVEESRKARNTSPRSSLGKAPEPADPYGEECMAPVDHLGPTHGSTKE